MKANIAQKFWAKTGCDRVRIVLIRQKVIELIRQIKRVALQNTLTGTHQQGCDSHMKRNCWTFHADLAQNGSNNYSSWENAKQIVN